MSGVDTVAIAGLGLIGGSLARDLAAAGVRVLAWDRDASSLAAARREGVVTAALSADFAGVEDADVFVLAVPVGAAPGVLAAAAPRLGRARLVTDAGSTKTSIVAAAERLGLGERFVGAHPLAGDHRGGWAASRAGLFTGATVYLCRTAVSSAESVALARSFWARVGGAAVEITAEEHDQRVAWSSHLPQVVSTVLAEVLAARGVRRSELGPGGRDLTRLASSPAELWADILGDNRARVVEALAAAEAALGSLRAAIAAGDEQAVLAVFRAARAWADAGS
jgi:prephenate dehydrogenase